LANADTDATIATAATIQKTAFFIITCPKFVSGATSINELKLFVSLTVYDRISGEVTPAGRFFSKLFFY
jgi:hypothetical protein